MGMHSVLLLLDLLPELLVEPGQVSRPGDPAAVLPLACRQPRSAHWRAPGPARRSVPPLSLSHDHELHQDLSEGPQPGARDRSHQGNDGRARVIGPGCEAGGEPTQEAILWLPPPPT